VALVQRTSQSGHILLEENDIRSNKNLFIPSQSRNVQAQVMSDVTGIEVRAGAGMKVENQECKNVREIDKQTNHGPTRSVRHRHTSQDHTHRSSHARSVYHQPTIAAHNSVIRSTIKVRVVRRKSNNSFMMYRKGNFPGVFLTNVHTQYSTRHLS
jgi:hypothetical protein